MRLELACPDWLVVMVAPFEYRSGAPWVVQPDVCVARLPISEHALEHRPELTIEVLSPNTRNKDLRLKRTIYSKAGIPNYWLLDPAGPSIEELELVGDTYRSVQTVKAGEMFVVDAPVPLSFDPAELVSRRKPRA